MNTMSRSETTIMDGWEFTLQSPEECNFSPVYLPHDWAIYTPINRTMQQAEAQGFRDRKGTGWYRKTLSLHTKEDNYVYQLEFDGIYENSTIWVNGIEVGGRK